MAPTWTVQAPRRALPHDACQPAAAGSERSGRSAARNTRCARELVGDSQFQVKPLLEGFGGGAPSGFEVEVIL